MRWKNVARFLPLALTCGLLSPGCATLTRNGWQRIPVTSSPAGAAVIINGIQKGATPLIVKLATKQESQIIRIESPGFNPLEIRLRRRLSGETLLGSLFLGLMPGLVPAVLFLSSSHTESDPYEEKLILSIYLKSAAVLGGLFMLTDIGGEGYHLTPKTLTVTLAKAEGPPRVDTMLVDADDFRNVKWIRVHRN